MRPIFDTISQDMTKRRTCMLMVTHACNLNCTYCYESHKSNKEMSFELAKSIITKEFDFAKKDKRFEKIEIDFMGGEPLMNFELIKKIVEWLRVANFDFPFICFATTNGTLLDESKKEWLEQNKDAIWLGASYDGSRDCQAINRGEIANAIDYDFFHKLWPLQGLKMTISKESLPFLAESIIETQKRGFTLAASLAHGIEWNDRDADIYISQLRELSKAYFDDDSIPPVNLLIRPLIGIHKPAEVQKRFCGAGVYMITYDVDGKSYGCHMFSPIVLGNSALISDNVEWTCETIAEDPRCRECILKDYCPTCMGFNYRYRGDLSKRDYNWCKMVLAEAIVSCEFQIKMLAANRQTLNCDEAMHGQAAIEAYPHLASISFQDCVAPFKRSA